MSEPLSVYFSYEHKDEGLRDELAVHLAILKRQGKILTWHDRQITAGRERKGEIDEKLNAADVILLLVSPTFVASDYCWDVELKRAIERHEAGEARVIPIILRPVDWSDAPFARLQALPTDGKPVTTWSNRDEAFLTVAKGLRAAIEDEQKRRPRPAPAPAPLEAPAAASAEGDALAIWQEKLAYLLREEAIASDANAKFTLKQRIKEARARIGELGAATPTSAPASTVAPPTPTPAAATPTPAAAPGGRKLKVFLNHIHEDKPRVRGYCDRLAGDGFDGLERA